MAVFTNPLLILKDPQIRKYFLSVLQSSLSEDDKYERFINFFELQGQVKTEMLGRYGDQLLSGEVDQLDKIASAASQRIGIWNPEKILQQTHESITRALLRLKHSQHRDGGWGFQPEMSSPWGTAFAVLCLNSANHAGDFNPGLDDNLKNGLHWLRDHPESWAIENIETNGSRSVYDLSIVIRCCYEARDVASPQLNEAWHKLWELQNDDGGWDARVWADDYPGLTRVFSDVGATRMALQALATVKRYEQPDSTVDFASIFLKGLQWFLRTQNEDGSWNNKSCTPNSTVIEGYPSITKTCDGIKGILTATNLVPVLDEKLAAANAAVDNAVNWLLSKEQALYDPTGTIAGWGWGDEMIGELRIDEMQNTWLTLETLVQVDSPGISLPLLAANAQWLIKQQHQPTANEDPIEDGKWEPMGHTARIALSLIEFYKKIQGSPLFEKTEADDSAATLEAAS